MDLIKLKQCISLGALAFALLHMLFPKLGIDFVTLTLLLAAVSPWLAPLVKSLELPGGVKVEFQDFERAKKRAEAAGLLAPTKEGRDESKYSFQVIADMDPNLALAGLRIEIEKRLVELAQKQGIGTKMQGIGRLLHELGKYEVLSEEERLVLIEMIGLLNAAVHGENQNYYAAQWALEIGPRLLSSLDNRLATA